MKLQEIVLRSVRLPLVRPYVLSYRTFTEFEPIVVEVRDGDGRVGWGEGHISPGSSRETPAMPGRGLGRQRQGSRRVTGSGDAGRTDLRTRRIKRASKIPNIGFCKLKLKRFGGLDLLRKALDAVREFGMESVLGDGLSSELGCWMEACIASVTIRNAGEFNGFLKPKDRLFADPLRFIAGNLVLPAGFVPRLDTDALAAHETACQRFAPTTAGWTARVS